jgi:hypothetical protein
MKRLLAIAIALFLGLLPASSQFIADAKISVSSTIVANNTTAIVLSTRPAVVYQVDAYNNATTLAYVKLYDATTATCGSGTPKARYMIPFGASSSGGGFVTPNINGDAYAFGVVMCVTTGIADSDTGAPAATTYIVNVHLKQSVGP